MTEILPANKWGRSVQGNPPKLVAKNVREMTVHYTGAPNEPARREQIADRIKRIERQHQARTGDDKCSTIAYNFIVDRWGRIWEGRGWDYMNAANGAKKGQPSSNPESFSVLVLVGVEDNRPTPEIVAALRALYAVACKRLRRKQLAVLGHRDHIATSCPGAALYRLVRSGRIQQARAASGGASGGVSKQSAAPEDQTADSALENATPAPLSDETTYRVGPGDTYWALAVQLLGDGARWPELSALNNGVVLRSGLEIKVPEA